MAKMPYGLTGPITGKLGVVITATRKNTTYVYPTPRQRKDKPSESQAIQRAKMAAVSRFLFPMKDLLPFTFYKKGDPGIPWNRAVSCNMLNAVYTSDGQQKVLYSAAVISQGTLTPAPSAAAATSSPGVVTFTWKDNSGQGTARAFDKAILVVYCESAQQCVFIKKGAGRYAEADAVQIPAFVGKTVHTWLAFGSYNGKVISPGVYTGELTL